MGAGSLDSRFFVCGGDPGWPRLGTGPLVKEWRSSRARCTPTVPRSAWLAWGWAGNRLWLTADGGVRLGGWHAAGAASGCGGGLAGYGAWLGCLVGSCRSWQVSVVRHSRRRCELAGQPASAACPCCEAGGGSGALLAGPAAWLADVAPADKQQLDRGLLLRTRMEAARGSR
jgi:hypothetical protein